MTLRLLGEIRQNQKADENCRHRPNANHGRCQENVPFSRLGIFMKSIGKRR